MKAPAARGYGTSVIRELVPYELGGSVDLAFVDRGVRCTIEIPALWVTGSGANGSAERSQKPDVKSTIPQRNRVGV